MDGVVVTEHLEDAQSGSERKPEDGENTEGSGDLLTVLGLDETGVVGRFGENLREAGGQAMLPLIGQEQLIGRAVRSPMLSPVRTAESGDVLFQRRDSAGEPWAVLASPPVSMPASAMPACVCPTDRRTAPRRPRVAVI